MVPSGPNNRTIASVHESRASNRFTQKTGRVNPVGELLRFESWAEDKKLGPWPGSRAVSCYSSPTAGINHLVFPCDERFTFSSLLPGTHARYPLPGIAKRCPRHACNDRTAWKLPQALVPWIGLHSVHRAARVNVTVARYLFVEKFSSIFARLVALSHTSGTSFTCSLFGCDQKRW